jgi:hypothetical protein
VRESPIYGEGNGGVIPHAGDGLEVARQRIHDAAAAVILAIGGAVIANTPVGTAPDRHPGNLVASWYAVLSGAAEGAEGGADPHGSLAAAVATMKPGDVVNMTNVAPYAQRTEFGGTPHHRQRPHAFVRQVLDRADAIAADALAPFATV